MSIIIIILDMIIIIHLLDMIIILVPIAFLITITTTSTPTHRKEHVCVQALPLLSLLHRYGF